MRVRAGARVWISVGAALSAGSYFFSGLLPFMGPVTVLIGILMDFALLFSTFRGIGARGETRAIGIFILALTKNKLVKKEKCFLNACVSTPPSPLLGLSESWPQCHTQIKSAGIPAFTGDGTGTGGRERGKRKGTLLL